MFPQSIMQFIASQTLRLRLTTRMTPISDNVKQSTCGGKGTENLYPSTVTLLKYCSVTSSAGI